MDWAEKYRPAHLQDITGNTAAVRQMADWAKAWTRTSKPLLLYGKPGTGKTSSAYALANDMGWEVIELNASDQRTASVIDRIAGAGSTTASLTGSSRKLIVMDEADNLQGTADRGGAKAIIECIRNARQPMILIANDLYGLAPELRLRCEPVQFKAIPARSIATRLKYICSAEKVPCTDAALHGIAESAEGDVRSAVNMLYAAAIGRETLTDEGVHTSQKDERVSIFFLITALFGRTKDDELMRLSREVDDTPDVIAQWVEGNAYLITSPAGIEEAYRHLSRADEYLGYTYRRQYHTLWRYATSLMLLGFADAADGKGIHTRIMPPGRWQKISTAKKQKAIRTAVLGRFAETMHIPQNTLREQYLGTISLLVNHDPSSYARELALDADQLNFFLNDRARAAEVVKAVVQQEREREKELLTQAKKGKQAAIPPATAQKPTPELRNNFPEKISGTLPEKSVKLSQKPLPKTPQKILKETSADEAKKSGDKTSESPQEKKPPAKTQSTLFDGF